MTAKSHRVPAYKCTSHPGTLASSSLASTTTLPTVAAEWLGAGWEVDEIPVRQSLAEIAVVQIASRLDDLPRNQCSERQPARGGSFICPAAIVRSAYRIWTGPANNLAMIGFRLARSFR